MSILSKLQITGRFIKNHGYLSPHIKPSFVWATNVETKQPIRTNQWHFPFNWRKPFDSMKLINKKIDNKV
jgi:hypothetical protein